MRKQSRNIWTFLTVISLPIANCRYPSASVLVEFPDSQWRAFEIKLGANQIDAAAQPQTVEMLCCLLKKAGSKNPASFQQIGIHLIASRIGAI